MQRNVQLVSLNERAFIEEGVNLDIRADGRTRLDCRHFVLETGIVSQAAGSARLTLASTDILIGIKTELAPTTIENPDEGRVVCSVDCSAIASVEFEGRGSQEMNAELSQFLQRLLNNKNILDLNSLCVIPNIQCWILYIDALVLDFGGNLLDCLVLATRAALFNVRIPNLTIVEDSSGQKEIELSDDPLDVRPLDISNVPVGVTLVQIGKNYIIDATEQEEACSNGSLFVAVNGKGNVCMIQKRGNGSIYPSLLQSMIQTAKQIGVNYVQKLDTALKLEQSRSKKQPKLGFLA